MERDNAGEEAPHPYDEPPLPSAPKPVVGPVHPVAPDPEVGELIGPYRLEMVLGRGGAGTVFKARHEQTAQVVALKVLSAAKVRRARVVQRFFDEVRAASLVHHPGLVEVHDFIEEDEPRRLAYAMEFVDGESLRVRLRREGALDLRTAIAVGQQVCDALGALHGAGIIHRDLKPENILLVPSAGRLGAKLLDFGVVKFLPVDKTVRQETASAGTFVGTPRYMAPEQAAGAAVDHRADLFALGVMLFEMITGHCPHKGDSLRDVVLAKLKGAPRITVNPEQEILPQELTDVVDACLKLKPALRPPSAARVGTALAEAEVVLFAVGRPVRAPPPLPVAPAASAAPLGPAAPVAATAESGPQRDASEEAPPGTEAPSVAATTEVPTAASSVSPRSSGSARRSFARRAFALIVVVATAVALAVAARVLTQEGSVLVLPERGPGPASSGARPP